MERKKELLYHDNLIPKTYIDIFVYDFVEEWRVNRLNHIGESKLSNDITERVFREFSALYCDS